MRPYLFLLAFGAFAIGMEGLMIAGLLPAIADHLRVSLSAAGWLVICFSGVYTVTAPLAAALAASFERRRVLVVAMAGFALGNLACALAPDFATLIVARLATAVAAATYMPAAMAYAGASVPAEQRGRALGLVGGGVTTALVVGVPLGTWIGTVGNWRWPFLVVAGLGVLAIAGFLAGVPHRPGAAAASVGQRLGVLKRPRIRAALGVTVAWATGAFAVYTFIAPVLAQAAGWGTERLPPLMLAWGIAASVGSVGGGWVIDRVGARPVAVAGIVLAGLSMVGLSALTAAALPALALLMLWAVAGWAVNPAQQARLVAADPEVAQISLSLHASGIYAGSTLGTFLGSVVMAFGRPDLLGWTGAACELAALALLMLSSRAPRPALHPQPAVLVGQKQAG